MRYFLFVVLWIFGASSMLADEWIVKPSVHSVAETVDKLVTGVEGAGATVFAKVDHAKGAESIGEELSPTVLVIFGNPKVGTPLLQANPRAGLDLPLRVLIWEDADGVQIGYLDPVVLGERYDLEEDNPSIKTIGGVLDKLTTAAAS